jgi:hypothetical protein
MDHLPLVTAVHARRLLILSIPLLTLGACTERADSVVGRWERIGQPREWVQFAPDGTVMARSFMGPDTIRGTYTQDGTTVVVTSNYSSTLALRGSLLVMDDGTRYRRIRTPP